MTVGAAGASRLQRVKLATPSRHPASEHPSQSPSRAMIASVACGHSHAYARSTQPRQVQVTGTCRPWQKRHGGAASVFGVSIARLYYYAFQNGPR